MDININKVIPNFLYHEGYAYLEFEGDFYKGCKRCGGEGHYSFNGEHSDCYACDNTINKLGAQFADEAAAQKWCHEKAVRRNQRERKAEAIRLAAVAAREANQDALKATDPDIAELLSGIDIDVYDQKNRFLNDMAENYQFGTKPFTPNMVAALRSMMERKAAQAAESEANPVVEGRQVITGEILSAKTRENDYGTQYKILVKDDRGFKVYVSIPKNQYEEAYYAFQEQVVTDGYSIHDFGPICAFLGTDDGKYTGVKGRRITFTATVEASADDKGFGFGSRPTKGAWL